MSDAFAPLAERVIDALLDSDPVLAHYAGDHRSDHLLPDFSSDAVRGRVLMLHEASHALVQLDTELLTPDEAVDHAMLANQVEQRLFELEDVRGHEWNPLVHNPGPLLHGLLVRPYAPVADRLEAVLSRLDALPDAVATATQVLHNCPVVHLETAVDQFAGVARLIRDELLAFAAPVPALAGRTADARGRALAALVELDGWLKGQLRTRRDARSPRLGRRLWEARLWHILDSDLSASELLARAWARLDQLTEEIQAVAAELVGGTPDAGTVRGALDRVAADRSDESTLVRKATDALAETTAFVRAHELVSLVADPCDVMLMPEFARGVAAAYCDAPGPLETSGVSTFFAISPAPASWPEERRASYYREYNNQMMRNLTVHEAMPGHALQLAHSRRYRSPAQDARHVTRTRAVCRSGSFIEGWAVYAEQLMVEHGFGGAPVRLQQLKIQLRMTINAILDQLVHCEELDEADGMRLMTERGFQEEGEAAGKWRRALLTANQLSTYFVGYTEVSSIAGRRPAERSPREWHDAMLAHGSPSPRHLAALLSS